MFGPYTTNTSKKGGKDQESIQSSTTPDPGYGYHMRKGQRTRKHYIQKSQEVSPFPAGDHKAAINRQDSMTNTKHKELIINKSTKEEPSSNGQLNKTQNQKLLMSLRKDTVNFWL